jgi:acetyl esterase/lipase
MTRRLSLKTALTLALLSLSIPTFAADAMRNLLDIPYATVDGKPLALDLHLPAGSRPAQLVVYLHGGAWQNGNKTQYPAFLVEKGFAVASLDFRSTNDAPFPANVHDIKAGIRFLRAKAREYGYRAERIGLIGASSGGHLAALVGVTNGNSELEGDVGAFHGQSSDVNAIVSYFGASNLTTILAQSTPAGLEVRAPALQKLFGGTPDQKQPVARLASPVFHVDRRDPPLMLLHGDQDAQMPINQLHELDGAYAAAGLRADTLVLHGVGHDAGPFFQGAPVDRVVSFLKRALAS